MEEDSTEQKEEQSNENNKEQIVEDEQEKEDLLKDADQNSSHGQDGDKNSNSLNENAESCSQNKNEPEILDSKLELADSGNSPLCEITTTDLLEAQLPAPQPVKEEPEDREAPQITTEKPKSCEEFIYDNINVQHTPREVYVLPTPYMYKTKKRIPQCLKHSFLALLLLVLFGGYIVGGGYLFSYLERNYEEEYNSKIDKWKNDTAILLATELRQVTPYEDIWARKVFQHLDIFERDLLKAKALGYRRKGNGDRGQRWSLTNAMFFSISLVTTAGYGSMTPRSEWGRTAVVCYSLVGIPLTLLCLASVGFLLASYWSWCFHHICCQLCSASSSSELSRPHSKKHMKFPRVRSNSIAPIKSEADILETSKAIPSTNKKIKPHTTDLNSFISESNQIKSNQDQILNTYANRRKGNGVHIVEVSYNDFLDAERRLSSMDHAVAIVFSVILFAVYFVFGSVTFAVTENWSISDSLYFSYLMFATLGPGCHETEDDSSEIRLKSSSYFAFLTMGYFIISMILNLIYSFCCSTKSDYCHTIYNSKFGYDFGKRNVKY